ncbi:hypothetical protein EMIHUDRAFT_45991, partial [Emiliania huxleyi CCMP1516]|uniref:Pseudouridine synthase RsuA/RluA-like domain-containing protein n=2 Tax=Emiliania huxleyi TaxID=2903 RepID=A0A0D3I6G3_EMIH1
QDVEHRRIEYDRIDSTQVRFSYLKMWKRRGVICTTDRRVRGEHAEEEEEAAERIFPIGRLDKDSSGLILLTSDGGLTNTLLRAGERKRKEYIVTTHVPATDADIARLAAGVVLTRRSPSRTYRRRLFTASGCEQARLRFVLEEGRNRQIRRMCAACGLDVIKLHRVGFAGITL